MGEDDWRWHMYDTVKGSDWLGDQDAIEFMCKEAPAAVIELEHYGVPFSRTEDGRIYQRPFGGMTTHYGKGTAQRTCAAADRTGHAMLHTLYQQSLRHEAQFFIEYFALDLIMENGECRGVVAHRHGRRHAASVPRASDDPRDRRLRPRVLLLHLGAHLHRRRRRHGAARGPAAAGHGVRAVPSDRHLRRRLPDHRRRARRGRHPAQLQRRALHGALRAERQGSRLARRREPRDDDRDSRRPRRRRSTRTTSTCTSSTSAPTSSTSGCRASPRPRRSSPASTSRKQPIPVLPTVHYNMGGIPTNYHGEVVTLKNGNPDSVVPGLMAVGEAACVSVHGANRLGSNSLLDLVVFGREAARHCADDVKPGTPHRPLREGRGRPRGQPHRSAAQCQGLAARPREIRLDMQRMMQTHAAVFRTGESLERRRAQARRRCSRRSPTCSVSDRSLVWNTDLIETLELDNLLGQARGDDPLGGEPQGEPRRACARGLPGARRRRTG